MGRGDKRTAKGKRTRGSFGNSRDRDKLKARAKAAAAPKKEAKPAESAASTEASA
jgi:ribosomal small subunit protein bTHX